ncbi:MAG: MucBP domain-containing protein [Lachnospiraceae bacterium]|nr:MucBP domain-containing protein [Lachnospiraceae bacterium]
MRGKTGRESKIARLALAFVAMVVMFVMFGPATQKAWADGVLEPVKYVDAAGNTLAVRDYVRIDENLPQELDTGWYYIDGNEYFTNGLNISGNVNLILCDGQYLVFLQGVYVPEGASLTIWAQKEGTGVMNVLGIPGSAAIGGNFFDDNAHDCGTIIINGGNINVESQGYGAGIGSCEGGKGGSITINGGKVQVACVEGEGAAIGAGYGGTAGTIIINGGVILADARGEGMDSSGAEGIGGDEGIVQINGGEVTAYGGNGYPGIGGSEITLGWTNTENFIEATYSGTLSFAEGKKFQLSDTGELATLENINGKKIVPLLTNDVNLDCGNNGSLTSNVMQANNGQVVTLTVSPATDYVVTSVRVNCNGSDETCEVTYQGENTYTFVMPDDSVTVVARFGKSVDYVDAKGNPMTASCCDLSSYEQTEWEEEWYAVTNSNLVYAGEAIHVHGNVNLILCDNTSLNATYGIIIDEDASLTIWQQKEGWGSLNALATDECPGIGGNVIINGGEVTAFASKKYDGIGGENAQITINGGHVYSNANNFKVGIGGKNAQVTINNGYVFAVGADFGAGIGGEHARVVINKGEVEVYGGESDRAIGGHLCKTTINGGKVVAYAPICNWYGTFTIRGGKVWANGGFFAYKGKITIDDGEVYVKDGFSGDETTITINGGCLQTESSTSMTSALGNKDGKVIINGGQVYATAESGACAIGQDNCEVILGWTLEGDIICCEGPCKGNVSFAKDKVFRDPNLELITAEEFVERSQTEEEVILFPPVGVYHFIYLVSGEGSLETDPVMPRVGQTVTVTERHSFPYVLDGISANMYGYPVDLVKTGANTYTFTMPDGDVTIEASYHEGDDRLYYMNTFGNKCLLDLDQVRVLSPSSIETHLKNGELSNGWYAVCGDIAWEDPIRIAGRVNLLLCDGATLTAEEGIVVPKDANLVIWGQKEGSGVLIAEGLDNAGIGGSASEDAGYIIINGGTITAKGGYYSAGIGGTSGTSVKSISIYGGTILAEGDNYAAGIGGGEKGSVDYISIEGGTITATAGSRAPGIGSGYECGVEASIFIHGGMILAKGGNQAPGIGAGAEGGNISIKITGGQVTAVGGKVYNGSNIDRSAPGIGCEPDGNKGSATILLSWTDADDFIESSFGSLKNDITLKSPFTIEATGETVTTDVPRGEVIKLVPPKYTVTAYSRASGDMTASIADVSVAPSGKVAFGESVTVTAPDKSARGYSFLGWHAVTSLTADGNEVASYDEAMLCEKLSYTFTMSDKDEAVVAVYEARGNAQVTVSAVNGAKYFVNNGPTAQGGSTENVQLGTTLLLTAGDADKVLCWMNESNKVLGTKDSLRLVVTGDTKVTLVYKPEEANGAFVQFENDFGQVLGYKSYSASDVKIDFPIQPSKFGFTFEKWVFKGTTEEATQEQILSKVANGGVITVVPKYVQDERKYGVTVRYQDADGAEVSADVQYPDILVGTGYTVTAPTVSGYMFSCWKDSNGTVLGYNENYYFLVASDSVLTAVYAADGSGQQTQAQPVITIGMPSAVTTTDAHKVSCTVTRSIPDGYELQEHGILYAKGVAGLNETTFVYGTAGVSKYQSDKTSTSGVVKLNVKVSGETISSGDNVNVSFRGYMILKDGATGNLVTYYTDIASGNYAALNTHN